MEIDIRRKEVDSEDVRIRFGQYEILSYAGDDLGDTMDEGGFYSNDEADGSNVAIYLKDIDNLILALKKAKELWGGE